MSNITRRSVIAAGVIAAGTALGAGINALGRRFGLTPPDCCGPYGPGETLTYAAHRLLGRNAMAREFPRELIAAKPFANPFSPPTAYFKKHEAENFANWRVTIDGLVDRKTVLSVADVKAMEKRSQITEVVCEEGWSYVAEWAGAPLSTVLKTAGLRPEAKWVLYYSSQPYWRDAIDIDEAMHPQTLLAWEMNGANLPVPFGGPLRMRVPRQLGYKSVKFINRIIVTDTLEGINWGDYSWYAGI